MEEPIIIDVRQAIEAAKNYLHVAIGSPDSPSEIILGLRLEETELTEDNKNWLITLGFDEPIGEHLEPLQFSGVKKYKRNYKVFTIDAETKEVRSMKSIRV